MARNRTANISGELITNTIIVTSTGANVSNALVKTGDTMTGELNVANNLVVTGNVGIGTSSPTAKLSVDGSVVFNESGADVDFRVESDTNANAFFLDGANGNVGIGTNAPAGKLELDEPTDNDLLFFLRARGGNEKLSLMRFFTNNSGGVNAGGTVWHDGSALKLNSGTSIASPGISILPSGNVGIGTSTPAVKLDVVGQIRASTGILFGTDTAAANSLDDYEEGTWTPVYAFATSGSATMVTSSGTYTKVGRMVTVNFIVNTSAISSPTGAATITGLPFTSSASGEAGGAIGEVRRFATDMPNLRMEINPSSTEISLLKQATNSSASTSVDGADFNGGANQNRLHGTVTYFV